MYLEVLDYNKQMEEIKMNPSLIRKTLMASSVALTLGAPGANAALVTNLFGTYMWSTDSANFTMLDPNGYVVGGTNDVKMLWDGNAYNSITDYVGPGSAANVTASSTAPFFSNFWTAHDIQVFIPGSYTFDTVLGGGSPESGMLTMNVGTTQLGMHMLFDWGGSSNIDVVVVANQNSVFGAGIGLGANPGCASTAPASSLVNCLYDQGLFGSAGAPIASNPWMLASTDGNGDGIMGVPMALGGPFQTFNANFNANFNAYVPEVPVPPAAWLFGSGLISLVGFARRRKKPIMTA